MLQYFRTDVLEGINFDKTSPSKECMFCHYWYFKDGFDNCYNILMTAYELENLVILNLRGLDYRCVLWRIKNEAVIRLNDSVLEDMGVYKWILAQIRRLLK